MDEIAKRIKQLFACLGVIFIGAVGSGVWEVAGKPAYSYLVNLLFSLASLGMESVVNSTYEKVAQGHHEYASHALLVLFQLITAMISTAVAGFFWNLSRNRRDTTSNIKDRSSFRPTVPMHAIVIMSVICTFSYLGGIARDIVIHKSIRHYKQMLTIVSPYVDAHERLVIESNFSQIRTRNDYVSIVKQLESLAKARSLKYPDYVPW